MKIRTARDCATQPTQQLRAGGRRARDMLATALAGAFMASGCTCNPEGSSSTGARVIASQEISAQRARERAAPPSEPGGAAPHAASPHAANPHEVPAAVEGTDNPHGAGNQVMAAGGSNEGEAGGLHWHAPPPLVARPPSSSMRAAEYTLGGNTTAELTVFYFPSRQGGGGDVASNLDRWVGQFRQADGRPSSEVATIERTSVASIPLTTVDVSGDFQGMRAAGTSEAHQSWRMLGAIAEVGDGMVFFKLTGPEAEVESGADAFRELLHSIHR